jgi:hypothetical protein
MRSSAGQTISRRIGLALCAAFVVLSPAKAEETAPADTAAFISYCEDHFETCRLTVVTINNKTLVNLLVGNHHGCIFPAKPGNMRADSAVATKAILAHLKTRTASRAPKTDDAIVAAIKTLWPEKCE